MFTGAQHEKAERENAFLLLGRSWTSPKSYGVQFCMLCITRAWRHGQGSREKQQALLEEWLSLAIGEKNKKRLRLM